MNLINGDTVVALRCYATKSEEKKESDWANVEYHNNAIVLVIDTETTTDEHQNLLFGSAGVWINGKLKDIYLFYNEELLSDSKVANIRDFGTQNGISVLSRKAFVEQIFFPYVYVARAECIGFNLPFDLSRLAIHFGKSRKFHNGFSLQLSENPKYPRISIKSLNSKQSFIEFTGALRKKSEQKYELSYKGYFVDLRTFTFALTNNSYTLEGALKDFDCLNRKIKPQSHGKINPEYIEYNLIDTKSTYELYQNALKRFALFGLKKEVNRIYSPASLGKAYLEKIGIQSFLAKNLIFPREILGKVMTTYFGGRTELRIRKRPVKVTNLDFTSMYPSLYVLLQMDKFLKAQTIEVRITTKETQEILNDVCVSDLADRNFWTRLSTICKINPDNDLLPIRSHYGASTTYNIGLNYLTAKDEAKLFYTLADLISSKLLTGKTPIIDEALTFIPVGTQDGLRDIEIFSGILVKKDEDFVKKLIEERIRIKKESVQMTGRESERAELIQMALKIIANSTSYGIFIEVNSEVQKKSEKIKVFGLDYFETTVNRIEKEGKAFNPIMATFITAAARLVLAISESLISNTKDGYLAYCDTDSLFVSPAQVRLIQDFFRSLNPYSEDVEMFKIEDSSEGQLHDIWFYGLSSKRYVLYDKDKSNETVSILKSSGHGLGHLTSLDEERWWKEILQIHFHPERKEEIMDSYSGSFAISQLTISNYDIFRRFENLNARKKKLAHKIKPFNFITVGPAYRNDRITRKPIVPMLPFVPLKRISEAPYRSFVDYKSGKTYPNSESFDPEYYWNPLSEYLREYIDHPESKFDGNLGPLKRKHLIMSSVSIQYIGKESNDLEEADVIGVSEDKYTEYTDNERMDSVMDIISNVDVVRAKEIGISRRHLFRLQKMVTKNLPIKLHRSTAKKLRMFQRVG